MSDKRSPWQRFYSTANWQKLRAKKLREKPLCARCLLCDVITAATVVNHIKPHKGCWCLFNDYYNLESVCKHCHDSLIQREERGRGQIIGLDGWPQA